MQSAKESKTVWRSLVSSCFPLLAFTFDLGKVAGPTGRLEGLAAVQQGKPCTRETCLGMTPVITTITSTDMGRPILTRAKTVPLAGNLSYIQRRR